MPKWDLITHSDLSAFFFSFNNVFTGRKVTNKLTPIRSLSRVKEDGKSFTGLHKSHQSIRYVLISLDFLFKKFVKKYRSS